MRKGSTVERSNHQDDDAPVIGTAERQADVRRSGNGPQVTSMSLTEYLQQVSTMMKAARLVGQSLEDAVLINGTAFRSHRITKEQEDIVRTALQVGRIDPQPRECFRNAALIALFDRSNRLRYVEGFALQRDLPIPIHHAWCVLDEAVVIDLTWEHPNPGSDDRPYGDRIWGQTAGIAYRGITIPSQRLADLATHRYMTPLQRLLRSESDPSGRGNR